MLRLDSSEMLPGSQKGEEAHKFWAQPLWLSPESVVSTLSAVALATSRHECVRKREWNG